MFTAITVTRTMLHLVVNWPWARSPKLFGLNVSWLSRRFGEGRYLDVIGRRQFYFAFTLALMLIGLGGLATGQLKAGIDFTGGSIMQARFQQAPNLDQIRAALGKVGIQEPQVQTLLPLGPTAALKLTTARYYTPSGHSVQEGGIDPDIAVPQLSDPDRAKREKLRLRESDLRGHLVNEAALKDEDMERDRKDDPRFQLTAEQLKAKGVEDFQLTYALDTLRRTAPNAVARRN